MNTAISLGQPEWNSGQIRLPLTGERRDIEHLQQSGHKRVWKTWIIQICTHVSLQPIISLRASSAPAHPRGTAPSQLGRRWNEKPCSNLSKHNQFLLQWRSMWSLQPCKPPFTQAAPGCAAQMDSSAVKWAHYGRACTCTGRQVKGKPVCSTWDQQEAALLPQPVSRQHREGNTNKDNIGVPYLQLDEPSGLAPKYPAGSRPDRKVEPSILHSSSDNACLRRPLGRFCALWLSVYKSIILMDTFIQRKSGSIWV